MVKHTKKCKESLADFILAHYHKTDIPIHQLNYEFVKEFEFYLKTEQKCAHNTVMGYVKKLKKIVRHCVAMNWLDKDPFMSFKVTIKEVHRVVLTQDELDKLAYKEIKIDRLDRVRDVFLFCCYTGLSFVDVEKLKMADIVVGIDSENCITTNRTKTNTSSRIPLLPLAKDIQKNIHQKLQTLAELIKN